MGGTFVIGTTAVAVVVGNGDVAVEATVAEAVGAVAVGAGAQADAKKKIAKTIEEIIFCINSSN
ncbi:MAG: hypothetical protein HY257_06605 [Chloroflexi bacterium]|nr:hypothetical protein [Ignavibacteriales bacterium]MBI3741410.1 hypothetical protein [Chloroflexota bacterium]